MHGREQELKKGMKLPALMLWNSKCDATKDSFDTVEMPTGIQATSLKVDPLLNKSSSDWPIVKKLAFEDGIQSVMEANGTKKKRKQF